MNAVILYRIDSAKHTYRYYRMDVQRDLFGEGCLMRGWGRIGSIRQTCSVLFPTPQEAKAALERQRIASICGGSVRHHMNEAGNVMNLPRIFPASIFPELIHLLRAIETMGTAAPLTPPSPLTEQQKAQRRKPGESLKNFVIDYLGDEEQQHFEKQTLESLRRARDWCEELGMTSSKSSLDKIIEVWERDGLSTVVTHGLPKYLNECLGSELDSVFLYIPPGKSVMYDARVRALELIGKSVFIGHGHSAVWRELNDFISERLRLPCDEFRRESVAGISTTARLKQMVDNAWFAFLVMTGEEERSGGTTHARDNVIHEAGLFQGKLGFERAIIVLEDGCSRFSNIEGLTYISFPKRNISASFEEVRKVLQREGLQNGGPYSPGR